MLKFPTSQIITVLTFLFFALSAFAQEGFKPQEQVFGASGTGSLRFPSAFFDPFGRAFATWEPTEAAGGGFSIRENGPIGFKVNLGPVSTQVAIQFDDAGNAVLAWINSNGLNVAYRKVGSASTVTNIQNLGKVPTNPTFDLHMTSNGLAAIGWMASTNFVPNGVPKISFRAQGDSALFDDLASSIALDAVPSSSGEMIGVARESNGAAYAIWRKDQVFRESFKPTGSVAFPSGTDIALAIAPGSTPPGGSAIGGISSFRFSKNRSGKGAVVYNQAGAKNPGDITQSESTAAAIREPGGLLGTHTLFFAGANTLSGASDLGVLPDGRVVAAWSGRTFGDAACGGNMPPPHIVGTNTTVAVYNGSWSINAIVTSGGTVFAGLPRVAVANNRAIVWAERSTLSGQCSPVLLSNDVILHATIWPAGSIISQGQTFSEPTELKSIFSLGISDQGRMLALKLGTLGSVFALPFENGPLDFNSNSPTATPTATVPPTQTRGNITLKGKSVKSVKGSVPFVFNCTGESGVSCSGEIEIFTTLKIKKGNKVTLKKQSYGKCGVPEFFIPAQGTCVLKLNSTAKKIIKNGKKLKANVALRSVGVTGESKSSVTVT